MPKVKLGDVDINYYLDDFTDPWIESPVLLLHHGYSRNSKFWYPMVPGLARQHRVLRFDVRGCGDSSVPPEGSEWSAEQLVKDAVSLIDSLGIQKVTWVGEASGGVLGMLGATLYPQRIERLILCGTPYRMFNRLESDFKTKGFKDWSAQTIERRLDTSLAKPELVRWFTSEYYRTPAHVAAALNRVFARADVPSLVARIKIPTLVLAGAKGPNAGTEQMLLMKQNLPHARFVVFEGVGEGFYLLTPDRCVEAILAFMETPGAEVSGT